MLRRLSVLVAATALSGASATWNYFASINAVDGCGMDCVNTTNPYRCLAVTKTYEECETLCASIPTCGIVTWSGTTSNCWTRVDNQWTPTSGSNDWSACDDSIVPACLPPPPPTPNGTVIQLLVNATTNFETHPLNPGVTLDFWRHDDPTFGVKWGNSSAQEIDLTDPLLRGMTAALAPALLRLGGSPEDSITYDVNGTCVPSSGVSRASAEAENSYYCSQVSPYTYDCLTPSRWEALLEFASATGVKIIFGSNGCYGRMSANSSMDFSNIQALITATVASPHVDAFYGFELSNEVVPNTISPAAWAADATTLKELAVTAFTAGGLSAPPMVGPDQGGVTAIAGVAANIQSGVLEAFTYHQYPQCTVPADPNFSDFVMEPSCLSALDSEAIQTVKAAQGVNNGQGPFPRVWAGETADHSGGGVLNLTDTFRSSFYYATQLGVLPSVGVEMAARQCLSGGDYELLQKGSFQPNPDFFILWLFKNLIGGGANAFAVNASVTNAESGVRAFAFTASAASNGTYTILIVNLRVSAGFPVDLNVLTPSGQTLKNFNRVEYHVTGDVAQEFGPIHCNGVTLGVVPGTYQPPAWQSLGVKASAGSTLQIQPASITFVTLLPVS